jgi:hypothetical protein
VIEFLTAGAVLPSLGGSAEIWAGIICVAGKMIYDGWTDPVLGVGRYVYAMIGG